MTSRGDGAADGAGEDDRARPRVETAGRAAGRGEGRARVRDRWVVARLDEPTDLVTRGDFVVLAAALALAGGVAATRWFGVGGRGERDATVTAGGQGDVPGGQPPAVGAGDAAGASSGEDLGEGRPGAGLYAVVQNTDGFSQTLPLWEDATVTVTSSRGTNVIEVSGGRVRVSEADCDNQVCVNAGWASVEGQTITCLPHQLVVEVLSDPADASRLS